MDKNKVKYGLSNVHVWPIIEKDGVVEYGDVIKIPGAVTMSMSATGNNDPFHADNTIYYNAISNTGYDGNIEIAKTPELFDIEILGFIKDINGAVIENKDGKQKNFAMAWEFDGDANKVRHVNYNTSVTRPNVDGETTTDSKTPKTDSLAFKASPAIDTGHVKAKLAQGQEGYDKFFEKPYIPVFEPATPEG